MSGPVCDGWSLTHTDADSKSQSELTFTWQPPADGSALLGAFIIEDCGADRSCIASQALTPPLELLPGLFRSGFED